MTAGSVSDIQRLFLLAQAQAGLAMDLHYHGDRYPGAVLTAAEREEARNAALDVLQVEHRISVSVLFRGYTILF